jgi:hypothetical protein
MLHRLLIEFVGFTLDDLQRPGRTGTEAGPEPVTEFIGHQTGFAVDDLQRTIGAVRKTLASAIAEFLIYLDNLSQYFHCLLFA